METAMLFMGIALLVLCLGVVIFAHKVEGRLHELRKEVNHLIGFKLCAEDDIRKLKKKTQDKK